MIKLLLTLSFVLVFSASFSQKTNEYPSAPKDSIMDIYFNTPVSDPYQWMENPDDPRLAIWLEEQKLLTKKTKNKQALKSTLLAQINSLFFDTNKQESKSFVKEKQNRKYVFNYKYNFYDETPDIQYSKRNSIFYKTLAKSKDFQLSKKDKVYFTKYYVNEEKDLVALMVQHYGSDWRDVCFFDLTTGRQLLDTLKYMMVGDPIIWNDSCVYYSRYNKPNPGREYLDKPNGQKLFYHKLGTPVSKDLLVYQNPDTSGTSRFSYSQTGDKLIIDHYYFHQGKAYRSLSYTFINNHSTTFKPFLIYPNVDSIEVSIEDMFGDTAIIATNWAAPNGRILLANINLLNKPIELVPEFDVKLEEIYRLGKDKIACIYVNDGKYTFLVFDLKGNLLKRIDFPEGKKVYLSDEAHKNNDYANFCISSFYHPNLWYQLSLKDMTVMPSESITVPYDYESIETRYVKYSSKDGTLIPMYITCLKNTVLNGTNPTIIYGYGGYNITVEPEFDEPIALWILHGGIYAVPNIRGGGADNANWGEEGRRLKKQNAIDDFIAAVEYLKDEKYTSSNKIAINGESHGGMLIGAVLTQRPDLCKVAIAEAGVYDLLRAEKFTVMSMFNNLAEFGTTTDSLDFFNLKSYSPMHNVKNGVKYPNVLLITGDLDHRVPPLHTYKFMATLQEKGSPASLYNLYIIPGAGHSGAMTSEDYLDYTLYKYYFLFDQLGLRFN